MDISEEMSKNFIVMNDFFYLYFKIYIKVIFYIIVIIIFIMIIERKL